MNYQICHQSRASTSSASLQIQEKIGRLRDSYKSLSKQNRAGADLIWGSVVPPLFVPVSKGGNLRVLEAAIIGEKNPAHLYTRIVNQVVSQ